MNSPVDENPYRSPTETALAPPERTSLYGVRGWLLFLCVSLTILSPALVVIGDIASYLQVQSALDRVPGLSTYMFVASMLDLGLAGFSVYAGLGLWLIRRHAVGTAQVFLAYNAVYALAAPQVLGLLLPEGVRNAMHADSANGSRAVVAAVIWIVYLFRSQRVKNTYGLSP